MYKKLLLIGSIAIMNFCAQAQTKKTPVKTTTVKKTTTTASSSGSINASNYGKVIDYLNRTIDCMNAQQTAIGDRENILKQMHEIFVTRDYKDILGNRLTNFAPFRLAFDYAREEAGTKCLDAKPPAIMGAADVAFYNSNYKAVKDTFITIAKKWNEIASVVDKDNNSTYSLNEGKKQCEELMAAIDNYYSIRSKISQRTRTIQSDLFEYSVAKSPLKKQYVNMNKDLTIVQEFVAALGTYEEMQKDKVNILAALRTIEDASIKHGAELPSAQSGFELNYSQFYSTINDFVIQVKTILNGTIRERDIKREMDRVEYHYGYLVRHYNSIMSN